MGCIADWMYPWALLAINTTKRTTFRLHMPESGRVCVICKAADAKALFRHFMFWRSMFGLDFEYAPALTCAEMVEMQKEHNEKLDDVD